MKGLDKVRRRAEVDAKTHGYYLNSDETTLLDLLEGLKKNEERYGYPSCPCRVGTGVFKVDRDIICPCDYRDPDVQDFGACYCSLYVDKELHEKKKDISPILERRPEEKQYQALRGGLNFQPDTSIDSKKKPSISFYYCEQCGYVVYREDPPYVCPICRAPRERFSEIKPD